MKTTLAALEETLSVMEHQEDIVNKIDQYVAGFEVPFARSDITEMKDWLFGQLSSSQQSSVSANDAYEFSKP